MKLSCNFIFLIRLFKLLIPSVPHYLSLTYFKRYFLVLFAPSAIIIPSSTILDKIALVLCGLRPENFAISAVVDIPCCDIYSSNIVLLSLDFIACRLLVIAYFYRLLFIFWKSTIHINSKGIFHIDKLNLWKSILFSLC